MRKKGNTSESVNPSLDNHMKLAYNILKNLEDDIVVNKEIPELDQCSECNNEILTRPSKAITILSCGHTFHRICIEKKLLLTMPNTCPFPDCGKNVDIIEPFPNTNEESPISALSNRINESLVILSSPILRMERVENTGFQPVKSYLRCAKCSEDLSSSLPPVSSIRFPLQPQEPPKPLVYLTCKHIVHYACIDNPRKLCPICPSANDIEQREEEEEMDVDEEENDEDEEVETVPLESTQSEKTPSSGKGKKRANNATESSTSKKSKKHVQPEDSNILNKLIRELSSDTTRLSEIKERRGLQREAVLEVEIDRTLFNLYLKISNAEERKEKAHHELIGTYYYYGEELEKRLAHYRSSYAEYEALKKLYDEVKDQLPKEVTKNALQKKSDRTRKVYDLFFCITDDKIQRMVLIQRIKTVSVTTISNLSDGDIKYVASHVKKNIRQN